MCVLHHNWVGFIGFTRVSWILNVIVELFGVAEGGVPPVADATVHEFIKTVVALGFVGEKRGEGGSHDEHATCHVIGFWVVVEVVACGVVSEEALYVFECPVVLGGVGGGECTGFRVGVEAVVHAGFSFLCSVLLVYHMCFTFATEKTTHNTTFIRVNRRYIG